MGVLDTPLSNSIENLSVVAFGATASKLNLLQNKKEDVTNLKYF